MKQQLKKDDSTLQHNTTMVLGHHCYGEEDSQSSSIFKMISYEFMNKT